MDRLPARQTLRAALLVASLVLAGCAAVPTALERTDAARQQLDARGWLQGQAESAGEPFPPLFIASNARREPLLWIYIEGDGLAWLDGRTPSDDPTPANPVALQLALAQPRGAAAYIARPCQYVDAAHATGCDRVHWWTGGRFAPEVVAATQHAIDTLKKRSGAQRIVLVGYSGGGAVAALVASKRNDVRGWISVAGNLDTAAWTRLHRVDPLVGSLNPADAWQPLSRLPQLHWVGARDSVVPEAVAQSYAQRHPVGRQPRIERVDGTDHGCCWVPQWPALWQRSAEALQIDTGRR